MGNEATARLKINKLLENSGWRLLDDENGSKNVLVESSTSKSNSRKGSIDYLLLDKYGKPFIAINSATYWHALRAMNINDQFEGYGQLFANY